MNAPRFFILAGAGLCAVLSALPAGESAPATRQETAHVPFPQDYQGTFKVIRAVNAKREMKLGTIYANEPAAAVGDLPKLPYPYGSIVLMEWAEPRRDEKGERLLDAAGLWRKGRVVRIDVMRREPGFGEVYGESRAGEWEFASYRPDGASLSGPKTSLACAECHRKAAERDFVFRGRFPAIEAR